MPDSKTDETTKAFALKDDPMFKQLISVVSALGTNLKEIQAQNSELKGQFTALQSRGPIDKPPPEVKDDDLNSLDQAGLVKHIMSQVTKSLEGTLSPVRKDLTGLSDRLSETTVRGQLEKFAEKHPDIYDLGDEIKAIVDETPSISIDRAYKLARTENPEKAKTLDAKYYTDSTPEKRPFGGLTPTSGMTPGGKDDKMTPEQASDKAWEETVSQFPGLTEHIE